MLAPRSKRSSLNATPPATRRVGTLRSPVVVTSHAVAVSPPPGTTSDTSETAICPGTN